MLFSSKNKSKVKKATSKITKNKRYNRETNFKIFLSLKIICIIPNEIIVFKRDQETGKLSPTGEKLQIDKPSLVKFVPID